jgi:hypothetical protein
MSGGRPSHCIMLATTALLRTVVSVCVLIAGHPLLAETKQRVTPADMLRPVFTKHCMECHGTDTQEAQLDFDELLSHTPLVRDREVWRRVIQLVEMGVMPPEGASTELTPADRAGLLAILDEAITRFDYSTINDPGYVPVRRLSNRQYNNTIRDLFGVDLKPADRFPTDLTGPSGFDNSASTLFLQSALMERYIGAAERIVDIALPDVATSDVHVKTRELIFITRPDGSMNDHNAAETILRRFLLRAYRREPTETEMQRVVGRFDESRRAGKNFDEAIKSVLPGVLISPQFLLRVEASDGVNEPRRVSDWELASRLSYFLWSSMPDDELFTLASMNRLHEPDVLSAQVQRMLHDSKADSLGEAFAAQWFQTQLIGTRIRLDPIDNPWCTDSLMTAMREETALFFMSLLRDDRPIDELIGAKFTFMNEELARTLYKLDGILGDQMRRVSLTDPQRGGILGQASILAVTSSHKDTSPVKRGIFVLDTVLGTPPPPPPPNAGQLEEQLQNDEALTFREKLEQHANGTTCQACHATMDPIGFAMENFDYFGRWRTTYRGKKPIDASGEMPDGTQFTGPTGVKEWILNERRTDFLRQVVAKMLAFALGRELQYYDEPAIQRIMTRLERDGCRFQSLLQEVVRSYPFQYRKSAEQESS